MTPFTTVLTGVVSSLIGTLLFLGASFIFRKHIRPWIEDIIYRGVRIDGHWSDSSNKINTDSYCSLDLKQNGDTISGIYSHGSKNSNDKTTYRVYGEIRNSFLNASFWPVSSKMIDSFTFLGKIYYKEDALRIKGIMAYMDSGSSEVSSTKFEFMQNDS